jgi:hypothetical protein
MEGLRRGPPNAVRHDGEVKEEEKGSEVDEGGRHTQTILYSH